MAVRQDMIGILTTNGSPNMPVWGGMTKMTGPFPLTVGVPTKSEFPFCLDTAMGIVSKGKIVYAAERGEKIPLGWAVDKEGKPTDDPEKYLDGGWILPIGGYKGFGIITVLEILSGILTGGPFGSDIGNLFTGPPDESQGLGHFVMALNIESFMSVEEFKKRMDSMIQMMKASKLQPGVKEIIVAGEPEFRKEKERRVNGIPLSVNVIEKITDFAREVGLTSVKL
jgi:LDH2 family malate/lactate/ureidoglycolate dehydrogenase